MFRDCEALQESIPSHSDTPLPSWATGIFFEPPHFHDEPTQVWKLPVVETRWCPQPTMFVDGSCVSPSVGANPRRCLRNCSARPFKHAAAVHSASVNSFCCELYALILAIHLTGTSMSLLIVLFVQMHYFEWDCPYQFEIQICGI